MENFQFQFSRRLYATTLPHRAIVTGDGSRFLSSRLPAPAEFFALYIRVHREGREICNLWVRDELWKEDQTRSGNWALSACLAILRVALISHEFRDGVTCSWPRVFERCSLSSVPAMSLINGNSIK